MESVKEDEARVKYQSIIEEVDVTKRKTRIVCTLGAQCGVEVMIEMLDAGMDVARLNFSHGDHKTHGETLETLSDALKAWEDSECAIMLDTKGPEIRTGILRDGMDVVFAEGQEIDILTDYTLEGDNTWLTCSYNALPTTVKPGDVILISEGELACEVVECFEESVRVKCRNEAVIGERSMMTLPGCSIDLPTLTDQDKEDITEFGVKQGVDMIAASFIRRAEDVDSVREVLGPTGAHIKVIAKIETSESLKNFDSILESADGIMISWAALAMEIP